MQNDIENVRYVEMTFDHTISFDIQEIADANNFVTDDITSLWKMVELSQKMAVPMVKLIWNGQVKNICMMKSMEN